MRRLTWVFSAAMVCGLAAGCRTPVMNPVYNLVDDINDTHLYFDRWYCPRLDVSRAGKPDACGPIRHRSLYPDNCYLGCYTRYNDEFLYPPTNPYNFPSNIMPPPKVWQPPKMEPVLAPGEMPPGEVPATPPSPTPAPPPSPATDSNS